MPMVELDRYIIRKGHGIFNIHEFIDAMLGANSVDQGFSMMQDNHHDLNHDQYSGVEADAVKIAIERGLVSPDLTNIINAGPDPTNPKRWAFAFQQCVNAGAPIINEAIKRTNSINKTQAAQNGVGHREIPLAFNSDMRNMVAVPAWKGAVTGYPSDGKIFNDQGQLITQYVSKNTQKPESYARPYWVGLKNERQERSGGVKTPTPSKEIMPGLLHGDTIYFKDSNLKYPIGQAIIDVRASNPNATPEQLKELSLKAIRELPQFRKFAGIKHNGGLEHGKYSDDGLQQMSAEIEAAGQQAQDPNVDYNNLMESIHPELRGHASFSGDKQGRNYHGTKNNPVANNKSLIRGMKDLHGWDDETIQRVFANAHNGTFTGTSTQRLIQAIHHQENSDGIPPTWVGQGPTPPTVADQQQPTPPPVDPSPIVSPPPKIETAPEGSPASPYGESRGGQTFSSIMGSPPSAATPPPLPPPGPTEPRLPSRPAPPPVPVNPDPKPVPQSTSIGALPAPANLPPTPPSTINAYGQQPFAQQQQGENRMSRLMNRLGYAYESLFPNFNKSDDNDEESIIKEMLENVQIQIAKQEISTQRKLSIQSPTDVAMFATQMSRPASDIITIVHSRGDWNSLAKSFGMTHDDIQLVKVIFDE